MKKKYRNPLLTVDVVIRFEDGIVLIERANPPFGWALPGGFVDYGESLESAAVREAEEETSLRIELEEQFHTYSEPDRDPRHHTVSTVFIAKGIGILRPADDAKNADVFRQKRLPAPIAFDHGKIIGDYFSYQGGTSKKELFKI
jgi:ADP-ribose pyrophosphatase YjhB (NUDIX family)